MTRIELGALNKDAKLMAVIAGAMLGIAWTPEAEIEAIYKALDIAMSANHELTWTAGAVTVALIGALRAASK